ncbi:helix-turn-helix domain-containing protein [Chroococcidiopsis sp. CCNUC1]|uniref:AlbA family DNA-binding domain-containing protein n=1 Tax=Chroococcidiopsis sp. CCNUC1 TaxID=2653189 RepID=UPI0020200A95|nr:ATP-binding protein [Chroococcidiopsis sp. CCNUC1]URD50306.1 ATP-binding protein [Chroococcidiopsis sp. CCNUC1]
MDDILLEQLLNEDESSSLDFKRDQYPFANASNEEKSELLKDILAFTNAWRRTSAYILVGVDEVRGERSRVVGVQHHLDDASLQQFVNSKTQHPIEFSYRAYPFEGRQIGIITIPMQKRPVFLKQNYGQLKKNIVYVRRGSSSRFEATIEEIASMGAAEVVQNLTEGLSPLIQYQYKPVKLLPFTSRSLIQWIQIGLFSSIVGLIYTFFNPTSLVKWGRIGIFPSIIGFIYTYVILGSNFSIAFFLLAWLSATSLGSGSALRNKRNVWLKAGISLKSNSNGNIFLTETYGVCPFCNGTVKLKAMPKGSDQRNMGICQINSEQHTFSFDFTTYMGKYYPIVWRKPSS